MKNILNIILSPARSGWITAILLAVLIVSGCQDKTDLTGPSPKSGNADLTQLVSIGNSITAGMQSNALYQSAQVYAYGNLIAKQVNSNYAMPLISDPGIGGLIEVKSFNPATGTLNLTYAAQTGTPINSTYPNPYNDLGIPNAFLVDVMNATTSATSASKSPFFDIILRNKGSQFTQTQALKPTLITIWIGNNDVLIYAASGGVSPSAPTDPTTQFTPLYQQLGAGIASIGAKVVVANIPDVTAIPFFTTVGPMMAAQLPWVAFKLLGVPGLIYEQHGFEKNPVNGIGIADSTALATGTVLITLSGSNYASLIGQPTGQFYRDYQYPGLPLGIDTTKPFGVSPQNPWPDALILDQSEITTAKTATAGFNNAIANVANANGFGLVDINSVFNGIAQHGIVENGIGFNAEFFLGGLFGLDGIHPTSRGQAVIANEFIKVINSKFNANYSLIDVASIPGSIVLAKQGALNNIKYLHFDLGTFKNLSF